MGSGGLRWVHRSICLVLCVPVTAVAQVCLVLSVPENSSDWQLTQIGRRRVRNLSYCRSHQSDGKKLPSQFSDCALVLSILHLFVFSQFIRSLSRTVERKIQFWAGRAAFVSYSRLGKLCKHVKTLCFGRDFPYRRVTLQNFDGESQIFEFLQFGAILLKI